MLITSRPSWFVSETEVTPEDVYINRREWLRAAGYAGLGLTSAASCLGGFARSPRQSMLNCVKGCVAKGML